MGCSHRAAELLRVLGRCGLSWRRRLNGKTDHGRFFLMSHGPYTEVSADLFTYSKWHASSLWVTHPLAFVAAYLILRGKRRSTM
jgi:hypothetical protein